MYASQMNAHTQPEEAKGRSPLHRFLHFPGHGGEGVEEHDVITVQFLATSPQFSFFLHKAVVLGAARQLSMPKAGMISKQETLIRLLNHYSRTPKGLMGWTVPSRHVEMTVNAAALPSSQESSSSVTT